jgi:geranyl-CoA carboxylase alpha subunit
VEFLLAGGEFTFMEMNTRLQVEHPVTEAVAGLDLVQWQLRVARGEPLSLDQDEVLARFERGGHAIEARLCAEDPAAGFLPGSGRVVRWHAPATVRADHAIESGLEVSPFYDSLLGKLIAHGPVREAAARCLAAALDETVVFGVPSNRAFLARVLRHPKFLGNEVSTAFIDRHFADAAARAAPPADAHWALAAFLTTRCGTTAWPPEWCGWRSSGQSVTVFRLGAGQDELSGTVEGIALHARVRWQRNGATSEHEVALTGHPAGDEWVRARVDGRRVAYFFTRDGAQLWLQVEGIDVAFTDLRLLPMRAGAGATARDADGRITAPMHGRVAQVAVNEGQRVAQGALLATLDAMKMEHAILAAAAGVVRIVHVQAGEQVAAGRLLFEIDRKEAEKDGAPLSAAAPRESSGRAR